MSRPNLPPLIGLCGHAGAGKDTVGAELVGAYGYQAFSFAAALKDVLLSVYGPLGLEWRHLYGSQADKTEPIPTLYGPDGLPTTGRRIAEIVGTEGFRGAVPTTWTQLGMARVQQHIAEGGRAVITDARFKTEHDAIRAAGGVVWKVVRVGGGDTPSTHASGTEWDSLPVDAILVARSGDLGALHEQARTTAAAGGRILTAKEL